ncbi:MAG: molybdate ABC transporter substrate-binding protein [Alphaproteobacteria bacterium]
MFILFQTLSAEKKILKVAVASNFSATFIKIQKAFEDRYSCSIRASYGSTSKLYQQIVCGAPFDVFLSADREHIKMLIEQGWGELKTYYTYAVGQLVLYIPNSGANTKIDAKILMSDHLKKIAIANPQTAPYGRAAQLFLKELGVWNELCSLSRVVTAENVAQAMTFILTKNADAGFIAKSQALETRVNMLDVHYVGEFFGRLPQGAIVIRHEEQNCLAEKFVDFLKTYESQQLILNAGYVEKMRTEEGCS